MTTKKEKQWLVKVRQMKTTIDQQLAEIQREIQMRKIVYTKQIAFGKMTPEKAEHRILLMEDAHENLSMLKKLQEAKL